ncbi:hypothetical protein DH2020_021331 [Rehmannia glutinosa]|uniref:non-specific serine/threonine protein kinase n=1 Tax=Rehmannia glutinosa TaxID=99300 RepID=A0ABR0WD37_REHGL
MENTDENLRNKPTTLIPPLPRDPRGSLEVFNPSSTHSSSSVVASSRPSNPVFRSQPSGCQSWSSNPDGGESERKLSSKSGRTNAEGITSWMALKDPTQLPSASPQPPVPPPQHHHQPPPVVSKTMAEIFNDHEGKKSPAQGEVGAAAQRAAEWGLVLKTDEETGKLQGVKVRTSGGDEPNKQGNNRRDSGNSVRSSGDLSDDGAGKERGFPRVSEDLKDALSTFQQTFVVSDATKPDFPIMYASAGFFKMTGYTSKEPVLQGKDTDPEDVAKIREALEGGPLTVGDCSTTRRMGPPFGICSQLHPSRMKLEKMQVEVSKHTEGTKEKMIRPNGLPESLIRYDARQKETASNSVTELVEAVKKPRARALSESTNRPFLRKSGDHEIFDSQTRRSSENPPPPARRHSHAGTRTSMQKINELPEKPPKKPNRRSFMAILKKGRRGSTTQEVEPNFKIEDDYDDDDDEEKENGYSSESEDDGRPDSVDDKVRKKEMRKGIDLATTLERIEKNFVITDPRLPDNPIIFASDSFLELTEYSREEILGRNCRFLQGPETDPATVKKIRHAIDTQTEVTVQLINYTKSGMGEVQYFIGVQLDGSQHVEPLHNCIPEATATESAKLVKETAVNVDEAVRELPDANAKPEDLWKNHSKVVHPKPHRRDSPSWRAIQKVLDSGEEIGLKHFKPIKPLGSGDTGSVHLVELCGTGQHFAMKAMDKGIMLNRNKVHRACAEREILDMLDHPFLPALYASFQTKTHICLITDYCPGGELFLLLDRQPTKVLKEDAVRDLKPENVLLQDNGHVSLTDFDLSCLTSCKPQLLIPEINEKKKHQKGQRGQQAPVFMAEPMRASNSFVGTEEYIAPTVHANRKSLQGQVILAVDWWALGILLYEMLYGYTPFRGKTRQKTFANILHKDIKFPRNKEVSLQAKQLMYRLLHRDPKNRLGSREGANEVKQHPFFRGINWALVRCMVIIKTLVIYISISS